MSMAQASVAPHLEQSSLAIDFFCHICGGSELEQVCTSGEVEAQIEYLRRFHSRRLRHPTESALKDRVTFTQEYITDIVSCRDCGLVCRSPRPSADAIAGAYSNDHYEQEHLSSEFLLQHSWAKSKARSLQSRLQGHSSQSPFVVEVGSFVGGFLAAGRKCGWRMMGVDPGKEVASFCRSRGLDVFCGTLIEAPIEPGTVDAVAIWNTFDQLPNPDSTLAAARHVLDRHGILVVRIPNGALFRRLITRQSRATEPMRGWMASALAWNNLLGFPYLYGYTIRTMDQLLVRHGFTRLAVCPDTLMTLAGEEEYRAWARWEERFVKRACLIAARVEQAWKKQDDHLAPWLDIYYRVAQSVPDTTIAVAMKSPAVGIEMERGTSSWRKEHNR